MPACNECRYLEVRFDMYDCAYPYCLKLNREVNEVPHELKACASFSPATSLKR